MLRGLSLFEKVPPNASASLPSDDYIQPNWGHALRIWWAFYWPTSLISGILGIALSCFLRLMYEDPQVPGSLIVYALRFGNYVITFVVAFIVMYYILHKNFRHFRIGLLSGRGGPTAEVLKPTISRTFRIWWTYVWRTTFYLVIAWIVVLLPMGWFLGMFNPGPVFAAIFLGLISFIVGAAVALFAIYSNILDEDFTNFHVSLVPRKPAAAAQIAVGSNSAII